MHIFAHGVLRSVKHMQDEEEMNRLTQRMKTLLGPFVLRRLKADVAGQLALKDQRLSVLDMTPVQTDMYSNAVQHLRKHAAAAGLPEGKLRYQSLMLPILSL